MSIGIGVGLTDLTVLRSDVVDVVKELYRISPTWYPANAKLPTIRDTWTASGAAYTVNGGSHVFDALAAGVANKIWEAGEVWAGSTDIMPSAQLGYARHEWSAYWDYTEGNSNYSTGAFVGLEIGTINSNAPLPSAPSAPCLQARINPTGAVELYSAVGDGVTAGTLVSTPGTLPYESRLKLVWDPYGNAGGPRAAVYSYDTLWCELIDPAKLPVWTGGQKARAGLIACSGSTGWAPRFVTSGHMLLAIG